MLDAIIKNKKMRKLLIPIILLSISCKNPASEQSVQSDSYYFPVKEFFTEKTDYFINETDTTDKSYWKMKTYISNKDTIFQTSIYDSKNRITDSTTEKVDNGNSIIYSYTMYDYDDQGNKITSECKVIDSVLFKTNQNNGESIKWKLGFKDYRSPNNCELSKVRTLISTVNDKKTFTDEMKFNVIGTSNGYQYKATMVYQKNIGLISYKMILPNGKTKSYVIQSRK